MTGTSTPSYAYPEHPWVTNALADLRSNLENDVYDLAGHLSKMARDYDAMQERNRTLQAETKQLRAAVRELVSCLPWEADDWHVPARAICSDCGREWFMGKPAPAFSDHAEDCGWRMGREAIGASPDEEW